MKRFLHQISITSLSGCGSSTLIDLLTGRYGRPYRMVSGGDVMRVWAEESSMTIDEFARYNREHPEKGIDYQLDQMINTFATQDYLVVEGRLPHIFAPGACKVLLVCPARIRARRRAAREDRREQDVLRDIWKRDDNDNRRYRSLYGRGCIWKPNKYDIVVDTSKNDPAAMLELVVQGHREWCAKLSDDQIVRRASYQGFSVKVKNIRCS